MRVVEADCMCPPRDVVEEAAGVIARGGVVVAPTDTVYGILADPFNRDAYNRVFRVKGRSPGKPLPILLSESHDATRLVVTDDRFWALARKFWPGPLTIVAPARDGVPEYLAPEGMVGVRLPDCPLTRAIARLAGGVVTGTSANKSGRTPPVTVYDASSQLGESVDLYIDGGPAPRGVPSTVVVLREDSVEVLREGAVGEREVLSALGYEGG